MNSEPCASTQASCPNATLGARLAASCRRRERAREKIDALDFPKLRTELSRAYDVATEMYELDADNPRACDYYDSLMDFAPTSQAAREVRQLTEELVNWRLKPSALPF